MPVKAHIAYNQKRKGYDKIVVLGCFSTLDFAKKAGIGLNKRTILKAVQKHEAEIPNATPDVGHSLHTASGTTNIINVQNLESSLEFF